MAVPTDIELRGPVQHRFDEVLTADALEFVAELQHRFGAPRAKLLERRSERRRRLYEGGSLDFLPDTREIREGTWSVAASPANLSRRWVEITGPTDRKMIINAMNSGADVFMADFEDANSPTWSNMVSGQVNLRDATEGTIAYDSADGRHYALEPEQATLVVRPRGWHLPERHVLVDSEPVAGALFDFGLYFFHCAPLLLKAGSAPYFYLPKLESHLEARLWSEVMSFAEDALRIPRGTVKATVLIETLPAAFEMDEILFELREHGTGLNAGRWDYIFSAIKCFSDRPEMVLPDRGDVKMTVPFMRAYTEQLVAVCHRRGAHAIGGMAALIPSRADEQANRLALEEVRSDKERELAQGYDGSWVAHPDLVPVVHDVFERGLEGADNQVQRRRDEVRVAAAELLDLPSTPGAITEGGLRANVNIGFRYLSFWLTGRGAAAINSLMEDAATAEISRTQIWQWVRHGAQLDDGRRVTWELVRDVLDDETAKIRREVGDDVWHRGRPAETRALFEQVALSEELIEFMTLPGYDYL